MLVFSLDSKFKFEQDIVFNPKSEFSYLYLAKIFKKEEDKYQEEKNIKTTLLLEPRNEEAMYLLIDIELKRSNFSKVEELNKNFEKICSNMCEKLTLIKSRLTMGQHSIHWNASNHPSGVYFIQMKSRNELKTQKVVLIK